MLLARMLPLALTIASATPPPKSPHVSRPKKDQSGIIWIEDDWHKAKQNALDNKQLVAVDISATWCHSCLSMRHFVFTDKAMSKVAKQHVWLDLDYDKPKNADFFTKFPAGALPTYLVIDPKMETVVARWAGTGTARQMAEFFSKADKGAKDPVTLGERALAREDWPEARKIFEAALKKPPKDKADMTRLLNGYIEALWKIDPKSCAQIGLEHLKEAELSTQGIDFVSMVAECAADLEPAVSHPVMEAVIARLQPIADKKDLGLPADDRSGIWEALTHAYDVLGQTDKADAAVKSRIALLEEAAAKAETPAERTTFDDHRLQCYLRLGRFDDAEKMLKTSEEALPTDFNHPWRLAILYSKLKKTDEGLAAIDRALARGYGARRLRLFATKVDLLIQKKAFDAAKKTVAEAKQEIAGMSPHQVRPSWVKEIDGKLEMIGKLEKSPQG